MKILFFTHEFPPIIRSGPGNRTRLLADKLSEKGFKLEFISLKFGEYNGLAKEENYNKNCIVHRITLPKNERLLFSFYSSIFSWINRSIAKNCDAVHALDTRDAPFAYFNGKPLLVDINDYTSASTPLNPFKFPWKAHDKWTRYFYNNFTKIIEATSILRANAVTFSNPTTSDIVSKYYKIPEEKINILGRGIDPNEYLTEKTAKKRKDILFIGGNLEGKGIEEMIKSISIVKRRYPSIKVNVISKASPEYMKHLQSMMDEFKVSDNFVFHGELSHKEIINLQMQSYMFVIPTYRDGMPQALLESMMAKLPAVGTNVGGLPYVIDDKKTGFLVEVYNVEQLAEKILFLLNNPKIAEEMGEKGREKILNNFTFDSIVERYIKIY